MRITYFCRIIVELVTDTVLLSVELFSYSGLLFELAIIFSAESIWLSAKKQLRSVRSALSFFKIIMFLSKNRNYFKRNVVPSSRVEHSIQVN